MKYLNRKSFIFLFILSFSIVATGSVLHVGPGQPYAGLMQAIPNVLPGDTIMIHQGIYSGGLTIHNLKGTSSKWITIKAAADEEVIFQGGSNSWQMIDAAYIHIKGIVFQHQTGNGFNIDDGGDYSTPTHHIIFENCIFRDINATGNNDLLKMSGIDDFEIRSCTFLNGSSGGSGIDMVGCHRGMITGCYFENMGSNSIQAKGGCEYISITRNFFKNGGQRSLNLGGSTGLEYFRPLDARFEAARLKVYSNIFIGSVAPIAFVGCIETEVINNTIYLPQKWVIRILQETVDTSRFYACSNNTFRNNLIYKNNQVSTDCNIGPNTLPGTFTFSNNQWFHAQNPGWSGPATLPVPDYNNLVNVDPMLMDPFNHDFRLQPGSPAIAKGFDSDHPQSDYYGNLFNHPPSIGASEGNPILSGSDQHSSELTGIVCFPNPVMDGLTLTVNNASSMKYFYELIRLDGICMKSGIMETGKIKLDLRDMDPGMYILKLLSENKNFRQSIRIIKVNQRSDFK